MILDIRTRATGILRPTVSPRHKRSRVEWFRKLWETRGSLWADDDATLLASDVLDDLEAAFGPVREDGDRVEDLCIANGFYEPPSDFSDMVARYCRPPPEPPAMIRLEPIDPPPSPKRAPSRTLFLTNPLLTQKEREEEFEARRRCAEEYDRRKAEEKAEKAKRAADRERRLNKSGRSRTKPKEVKAFAAAVSKRNARHRAWLAAHPEVKDLPEVELDE